MTEQRAASVVPAEQGSRNLAMRIVAALVLAPIAVAIAYAGGWLWTTLVTLAAIGLYIEWLLIVAAPGRGVFAAGIVALTLSGLCLASGWIGTSLLLLGVGVVAVALLSPEKRNWSTAGLFYAAAAQFASVLVRMDEQAGFAGLIFILLIVWASDIGGYVAGRAIGGPKLSPRISPKKTWAGAIAGFAASLGVALGFVVLDLGKLLPLLLLAAALSIVSQLGDLFESAVKRRFGVKDSSHLIPGHGGLMDRLDGFVAAIIFAVLLGFLRGGVYGVGRGLMVW